MSNLSSAAEKAVQDIEGKLSSSEATYMEVHYSVAVEIQRIKEDIETYSPDDYFLVLDELGVNKSTASKWTEVVCRINSEEFAEIVEMRSPTTKSAFNWNLLCELARLKEKRQRNAARKFWAEGDASQQTTAKFKKYIDSLTNVIKTPSSDEESEETPKQSVKKIVSALGKALDIVRVRKDVRVDLLGDNSLIRELSMVVEDANRLIVSLTESLKTAIDTSAEVSEETPSGEVVSDGPKRRGPKPGSKRVAVGQVPKNAKKAAKKVPAVEEGQKRKGRPKGSKNKEKDADEAVVKGRKPRASKKDGSNTAGKKPGLVKDTVESLEDSTKKNLIKGPKARSRRAASLGV